MFTTSDCFCAETVAGEWQDAAAGQAVDSVERNGPSGADILPDGPDVGHHCRVSAVQALSLSGKFSITRDYYDMDLQIS